MPLIVPPATLTLADALAALGVPDVVDSRPVAALVVLELADGRVTLATSAGLSRSDQLGLVNAARLRIERGML